jgi:hypothetical protein
MLPTPSSELPKPERAPLKAEGGELVTATPEAVEVAPAFERLNDASNAVSQAVTGVQVTADPATVQASDDTTIPVVQAQSNPAVADDVDVIEKEWVEKAKSIVTKTRHDPHAQSIELTHMKHDYMKKRYGREIKQLDESSA